MTRLLQKSFFSTPADTVAMCRHPVHFCACPTAPSLVFSRTAVPRQGQSHSEVTSRRDQTTTGHQSRSNSKERHPVNDTDDQHIGIPTKQRRQQIQQPAHPSGDGPPASFVDRSLLLLRFVQRQKKKKPTTETKNHNVTPSDYIGVPATTTTKITVIFVRPILPLFSFCV